MLPKFPENLPDREGIHNNMDQVPTSESTFGEITALLSDWDARDPEARARLLTLVYPELRRLAAGRMRSERNDHTLQPTALVNEFVLRLCANPNIVWRDRAHFLAVASSAMRRILVDYARARKAEKRQGLCCRVELDKEPAAGDRGIDVLEINEVLQQLAAEDPQMANIVEMRYFGGLTNTEVGEALGISERTVKRDWRVARSWMFNRLSTKEPHADGAREGNI